MIYVLFIFTLVVLSNSFASADVESAFIENEIVPDSLSVAPKQIVEVSVYIIWKTISKQKFTVYQWTKKVSYPSGAKVDFGNELTPTQVKDVPSVSWDAEKGAYYSLLLVDPDAPSRKSPNNREFRHWLVMNIPESAVAEGDEVIGFVGSGPPKNTGLHRYIYLVYKQPNGIIEHDEPRSTNRWDMKVIWNS